MLQTELLTTQQLQEALGCGQATAYALMHRADFPSFKIGKRFLVAKDALEAWLSNQGRRSFVSR